MKNSTQLRLKMRLTIGSFALALAMLSASASAQNLDGNIANNQEGEEEPADIIVTGSHLSINPNISGAQPVLSVTAEEIAAQGTVRIEDLTNQLPQVFAGQAGEISNGSTGTATLNLRGLGANRTLVLIDGRRLPYGASRTAAPNLDIVPTQLVERVDVLTGGASAVYGSDAVGGVANFILKNDYEGVEINMQGGFQQNGNKNSFYESLLGANNQPVSDPSIDGREFTLSGIMGINTADGRGNVVLHTAYEKRGSVTHSDRIFAACVIGTSNDPVTSHGGAGCVGSGNYRLFGGPGGFVFQETDGTIVDFVGGPAQTYNYGPLNYFQRPSERFTIYSKGNYEISENTSVFADISFVDNISDAQVAETASFGIGRYSVNCDNPYIQNSPGQSLTDIFGCTAADIATGTIKDGLTVSHRNIEGGPRNTKRENSTLRIVGGLRGSFDNNNWKYEIHGQFAQTSDTRTTTNDFIRSNVEQALIAVDNGTGTVVCVDPSGGCVPYNPFQRTASGTSQITPSQIDYIQGVGIVKGFTEQQIFDANIQADLGNYGYSLPWTDEGIGLLIGFEYRKDLLETTPDEINQIRGSGFTGASGAVLPVFGEVDVREIYSEVQVPIITDKSWADELTISGQYRYSDYEAQGNGAANSFSSHAYGLQLVWSPNQDLKFRGQFQRAVRAPNVIEMFTGQDQALPNLNSAGTNSNGVQLYDPCASNAPIATLEACANTGVTASTYGTILDVFAGQTQAITGGNPNLKPEKSNTWTFGSVYSPQFIDGLNLSLDYFNITVDDFISSGVAAQTVLDNCLETGIDAFCNLINRAPSGTLATGLPGFGFIQTNINIAELHTSGIDTQIHYVRGLGGLGDLHLDYASTLLTQNDFISFPGSEAIDCAGFLNNGCVQPVNPKYRHRATMRLETESDLKLSVTWRYFGATNNEAVEANPEIDDALPSINYVDLAALWEINNMIDIRAGVLNVMNQQPPVSASSGAPLGNGNTFPTIYDTARSVFAGVRFSF